MPHPDPLRILRGTTAAARPSGKLAGEIYINMTDGVFGFVRQSGEAVDTISTKPGAIVQTIRPTSGSGTPLRIAPVSSPGTQTANLLEVRNADGTNAVQVAPSGAVSVLPQGSETPLTVRGSSSGAPSEAFRVTMQGNSGFVSVSGDLGFTVQGFGASTPGVTIRGASSVTNTSIYFQILPPVGSGSTPLVSFNGNGFFDIGDFSGGSGIRLKAINGFGAGNATFKKDESDFQATGQVCDFGAGNETDGVFVARMLGGTALGSNAAAFRVRNDKGYGGIRSYFEALDTSSPTVKTIFRVNGQGSMTLRTNNASASDHILFQDANGNTTARLTTTPSEATGGVHILTRAAADARYSQISSARYKVNQQPAGIDSGAIIDALDAVTFTWGGETPDWVPHHGKLGLSVIAEQAHEVYEPLALTKWASDSAGEDTSQEVIDQLDTRAFCALFVMQFQEIRQRLDLIEGQIG